MNGLELMKACRAALRDACSGENRYVSPEDRWDMSQDLAVRFLAKTDIKDAENWLHVAAFFMVSNRKKTEKLHRELMAEYKTIGSARPRAGRLVREPGVSYMPVKASLRTSGKNDVEDATIACIDARARKGTGPKRPPVCPQELLWGQLRQMRLTAEKNRRQLCD
jgi:hypothetical protein